MGYTFGFVDNKEYGATDINNVISMLVSGGIEEPFENGRAYNVTELNGILYAISSEGVVPEGDSSCKCSIDSENSTVAISSGKAFFDNGSYIILDSEGITLPYEEGVKNYIGFISSMTENKNYPICTTEPDLEQFVLLAEVSEEGELTDKRRYARGKLPGCQSNIGLPMYIDETIEIKLTKQTGREKTVYHTIHLGENTNYSIILYDRDMHTFGYYDIKKQTYRSVGTTSPSGNTCWYDDQIIIYHDTYSRAYLTFEKSENDINVKIDFRTQDDIYYDESYMLNLKLIIY